MQALYLCPATMEDLAASIEKPVPMELVKEHFGPKYHEALRSRLGNPEGVFCWAIIRRDERSVPSLYEKMEEGDIILFRRNDSSPSAPFDYRAQLVCKRPSRDFGREVWPDGELWHFVLFFRAIERVRIDKEKLFAAMGYVPEGRLISLKRVAEDKLRGIHDQFGSLDAFLDAVQSPTPVAPLAEAAKDSPPDRTPQTSQTLRAVEPGECPDRLASVIEAVQKPFLPHERKIRDHTLLAGKFYEALGFNNANEIRYRAGGIDITSDRDGTQSIVTIVKGDPNLSYRQTNVRRQAYAYAQEKDAPIVVITNGDYYAFLDRRKGGKWLQHLACELTLSRLKPEDVQFLESCPWLNPSD